MVRQDAVRQKNSVSPDLVLDPASGLHTVYFDGAVPSLAEPEFPSTEPILPAASATVSTQIWLERFPWRPTAGWSAIGALLALNGFAWPQLEWRDLVLLLLLVDPLWGSIWRLVVGRSGMLPIRTQIATQRLWLPYLRERSPAARLAGWEEETALPLLFRIVLPSITLALAVALAMGLAALVMTALLVMLSALGWILQRTWQRWPLILQSLVVIALPWLLTLITFRAAQPEIRWTVQLSLLALWTLHHWGECRSIQFPGDRAGLVALGVADAGVALLLVLVQAPFWLAVLGIVWLPTWFLVYQRQPLARVRFWWLAALLLSALAVGVSY